MSSYLLEDVSVRFREEAAISGVDLRIEPGECIGIVGPSGAGKTTLLRLLIGALRPSTGTVTVDGHDLSTLRPGALRALRARTGFVHQDHRLVPNQRVVSNVLAGRLGHWSFLRSVRELAWPRRAEVERVHELLARTGIPEKLYQRVDSLSGGQQQRVALARALYQEPDALLADEPVSSVDPARARDTVALLTGIAAEEELTLCVSLHNLELARAFFPRLVGMRNGQVVFDRPADELSDEDFERLYEIDAAEMLQHA